PCETLCALLIGGRGRLIEAASGAPMARRAERLDHEQERVGVAVDRHVTESQDVAARFTLLPEPVSGAGMEVDMARLEGGIEGLRVHVSEHEDAEIRGILNDRWDEAVDAPADLGPRRDHGAAPDPSGPVRRTGRPRSALA